MNINLTKYLGIFSFFSAVLLSIYVLNLADTTHALENSLSFVGVLVGYAILYNMLIKSRKQIATDWLYRLDAFRLVKVRKDYYQSKGWDDKDPINTYYKKLDGTTQNFIDEKVDKKVSTEKWPNFCDSLMAFTTSVFIFVFFIIESKDYLTLFFSAGYCLAMFCLLFKNHNDMKKSYTIEHVPMFKVE
ncbi:hypothetical protein [Methanococcus sp. CF]